MLYYFYLSASFFTAEVAQVVEEVVLANTTYNYDVLYCFRVGKSSQYTMLSSSSFYTKNILQYDDSDHHSSQKQKKRLVVESVCSRSYKYVLIYVHILNWI